MKELSPVWFAEPPIDFEHKQYLLWSYLQKVDASFVRKQVSPFLLQLEAVAREMRQFELALEEIKARFDRARYKWFDTPELERESDQLLEIIQEIVDFSTPQIHQRIETGQRIFRRYKQVLY